LSVISEPPSLRKTSSFIVLFNHKNLCRTAQIIKQKLVICGRRSNDGAREKEV